MGDAGLMPARLWGWEKNRKKNVRWEEHHRTSFSEIVCREGTARAAGSLIL